MSVCVYFADENFRLSHALEFAPDGVMWVESFIAFEPAPEFNRPSGYGQHGFGPDWGLLGFAQLHLGGGLVDGVAEIKMRPQASGGARYRQRHLLPLFWVRGKPSSAKVLIN
ncbi:hypothetical protein BM221_004705 [Beauveria bassiana]|uniref:Uncharacterized protein n=1 Tax=Beauveria bassiana TaxID=176275 RepID=A0A2N6NS10_BEABA|nr:hypothetical protein BM221_004705 [Beauveria bassiana]